MKKRNLLLLIALIIAIVYIILQFGNYSAGMKVIDGPTDTAEQVGAALGTAIGLTMLLPHLILIILAAIFNAVGWLGKMRWAALTAAILYTVGGVLGLTNFFFVIPSMVLCYVAYAKMKKEEEEWQRRRAPVQTTAWDRSGSAKTGSGRPATRPRTGGSAQSTQRPRPR